VASTPTWNALPNLVSLFFGFFLVPPGLTSSKHFKNAEKQGIKEDSDSSSDTDDTDAAMTLLDIKHSPNLAWTNSHAEPSIFLLPSPSASSTISSSSSLSPHQESPSFRFSNMSIKSPSAETSSAHSETNNVDDFSLPNSHDRAKQMSRGSLNSYIAGEQISKTISLSPQSPGLIGANAGQPQPVSLGISSPVTAGQFVIPKKTSFSRSPLLAGNSPTHTGLASSMLSNTLIGSNSNNGSNALPVLHNNIASNSSNGIHSNAIVAHISPNNSPSLISSSTLTSTSSTSNSISSSSSNHNDPLALHSPASTFVESNAAPDASGQPRTPQNEDTDIEISNIPEIDSSIMELPHKQPHHENGHTDARILSHSHPHVTAALIQPLVATSQAMQIDDTP
jgi:hypothetical protein